MPKASPLSDEIYAVGDSLSDSGGIFGLGSQALAGATIAHIDTEGLQRIPAGPSYADKFSNGPVLPEITEKLLGTAALGGFGIGEPDPRHLFTFSSMDLTITGIERIVLTTQFGFADVSRPGSDLGERLHQADLFGLV